MEADTINWTNVSALSLARGRDPVVAVREAAQDLVLRARERGWKGPPFNPLPLVEMLGGRAMANSSIADARLLSADGGPVVEYNPQQPRERMRFSIAHEAAHLLFPDWAEEVRNRGGSSSDPGSWQLEMLCNVAASEFVLPIGSLPPSETLPTIETVMMEVRRWDVSAEAFLLRFAKVSREPISVFFASPLTDGEERRYRMDYAVSSPIAPRPPGRGRRLPTSTAAQGCTAIGHTDRARETWFSGSEALVEYVGIPGYPGARYPRVAGIVRHGAAATGRSPIRYVHGDVSRPAGGGRRFLLQLVNDRSLRWGGGVARSIARRHPEAEAAFGAALRAVPASERLGRAILTNAGDDLSVASLVAQEGYGPSLFPRIRYRALREAMEEVSERAVEQGASIHMPRIGTGTAGGDWSVVGELVDDLLVACGLSVTVYDQPPRREQFDLFAG